MKQGRTRPGNNMGYGGPGSSIQPEIFKTPQPKNQSKSQSINGMSPNDANGPLGNSRLPSNDYLESNKMPNISDYKINLKQMKGPNPSKFYVDPNQETLVLKKDDV